MRQKGFAPIMLLLVIVGLGLLAYYVFFNKTSTPIPQTTPSPTSTTASVNLDKQSSLYSNYKHYINKEAQFSFDYPEYLLKKELDNPYEPQTTNEGLVLLCESAFETNHEQGSPHCINGAGIRVWYNFDGGWLSPCPDNGGTINFLGQKQEACVYPDAISLYLRPNKTNPNSFLISISYSEKLTAEESEKILSSFKFIQ